MSEHDILPHQNIVTRYESPTPEQAAADICALERIVSLDNGSRDDAVANRCIRRRIATLQLIVERGAICDRISKSTKGANR